MNNRIARYTYEGQDVEFDLTTQRVLVNATQMAKICGKLLADYLRLKSTEEFTGELVKYLNQQIHRTDFRYGKLGSEMLENSSQEYPGHGDSHIQSTILTADDVIKVKRGGRKQGTWMDRIQALHFSAWLDARFAVWVFVTIDQILFEQQNQQETHLSQMALNEIRRERLEAKFAKDPDYIELQSLRAKKGQFLSAPRQQAEAQLSLFIHNSNPLIINQKAHSQRHFK